MKNQKMKPEKVEDATSSNGIFYLPVNDDLSVTDNLVDLIDAIPNKRDAFVVIAPKSAFLHPELSGFIRTAALDRIDVDVFYTDDVAVGAASLDQQRLKPAFNPSLLFSQDYIGAPLFARGSAFHRLGGLRAAAQTAALYDFVLRAHLAGMIIDRITEILLAFRGDRPRPLFHDQHAVIRGKINGALTVLPGLAPGSQRLRRIFSKHPQVTLIIPTRQSIRSDGVPFIVRLIQSLTHSTWPLDSLRLLIGDDSHSDEIYQDFQNSPIKITRVHTPRLDNEPFNYARKMNALWRASETEHIVLMNDDLEVISPDWLEALMTFAMDREVGGVGARLLYPSGAIQHAGMVGGIFGVFAHPWIGQDPNKPTYGDWAVVQRDYSVVTGAVFATRRSALNFINGFDENFALEYNDVDLCLRLRAAGYRIVQTPDALLCHHEKASRGESAPPGQQTALFLRRWGQIIENDPAYHPGLSRDGFNVRANPVWGAWYNVLSDV